MRNSNRIRIHISKKSDPKHFLLRAWVRRMSCFSAHSLLLHMTNFCVIIWEQTVTQIFILLYGRIRINISKTRIQNISCCGLESEGWAVFRPLFIAAWLTFALKIWEQTVTQIFFLLYGRIRIHNSKKSDQKHFWLWAWVRRMSCFSAHSYCCMTNFCVMSYYQGRGFECFGSDPVSEKCQIRFYSKVLWDPGQLHPDTQLWKIHRSRALNRIFFLYYQLN